MSDLVQPAGQAAMTSNQAVSVASFVNTLGVGTKMSWLNSSYFAPGINVLGELQYIGFHNVRDGANGNIQALETLMSAGIKLDLAGDLPLSSSLIELNNLEQADPGGILAVEGYNEIPVVNLPTALVDQEALYSAVMADPLLKGVQVYNYTVYSLQASDYTSLGSVSSSATAGNAHSYTDNMPPIFWVSWNVPENTAGTPGLPYVVTETGYNTAAISIGSQTAEGASQILQAKYTLDDLFDMFKLGVQTTYLYELMDSFDDPTDTNGELNFGLFNADGTPKLAATALHNLTTTLDDTGSTATSFTTSSLSYSIQGLDSNIDPSQLEADFSYGILSPAFIAANFPTYGNSLLMEKSDGDFDLAVWEEPVIWDPTTSTDITAPTTPVVVTLAVAAASVEVYDPLIGTDPIATFTDVTQITVGVSDHPIIIEIDPFKTLTLSPATLSINTPDATSAGIFGALTLSDPNAAQIESVTVALSSVANGILSDPNAQSDGSTVLNDVWQDSGSASSVTAALDSLVFTPTQHEVAPGNSVVTTITARITDSAGQTASTSAVVTATAVASPIAVVPGASAVAVSDMAHSAVFAGAKITDPNTAQIESVTVTLSSAANGRLSDPNAQSDGSTIVNGVWQDSGSASSVTAALNSLVFTPTQHEVAPGHSVVTTITAKIADSAGRTASTSTVVTATNVAAPIAIVPGASVIAISDMAHSVVFAGASITDPNAAQIELATVMPSSAANGILSDPNFQTDGSTLVNGIWQDRGSASSVTAALNSLVFTPTQHEVAPGHSVVTTITAKIGDSAGQTASTKVSVTAVAVASAITMAQSTSQAVTTDGTYVSPFTGLTLTDPNAAQTETAIVTLSSLAGGSLVDPNAQWDKSTAADGSLSLTGSVTNLVVELNALLFEPSAQAAEASSQTVITAALNVRDTAGKSASTTTSIIEQPASVDAAPVTTRATTLTQSVPTSPTVVGSGPDTIALTISQDAYEGNAQFVVLVNGTEIGGTQTATAQQGLGQSQLFDIEGSFNSGTNAVSVIFINDLYGGSPTADRNLYVLGATYDGSRNPDAAVQASSAEDALTADGEFNFTVNAPFPVLTTVGSGPDQLQLAVAEQAISGDAQFTVSVDGQQIGGVQTATAVASAGESQVFNIYGTFGYGNHDVSITLVNPASIPGYPLATRSLYVEGVSLDGTSGFTSTTNSSIDLTSGTPQSFSVSHTGTAPIVVGSGPDTLALFISEDYYLSNAQFDLTVDGQAIGNTQTATEIHGSGQTEELDVLGNFAPGSHTVSVDFLNDAAAVPYNAAENRNLYVDTATINGNTISGSTLTLDNTGSLGFSFTTPGTPAPVTVGGAGPDTLALNVSEDYYQGNGQFTVSVDGQQVGGVQTATAIHSNGQSQVFNLFGTFTGSNTVSVNFLNDATSVPYVADLDRNLYVAGASVDGTSIANSSLTLLPSGTQSFSFTH